MVVEDLQEIMDVKLKNMEIKEPFASQLRDRLKRYKNKEFTKEELEQQERSRKILNEYNYKGEV